MDRAIVRVERDGHDGPPGAAATKVSFLDFAQELARAGDVAALEEAYLANIERVLGITMPMNGVYLFDPRSGAVERYAASNVSDVFMKRYEEIGRSEDPIISHVVRRRTIGYSLGLLPAREWLASPVYRNVFALHQMVHAAQAPVVVDGELTGTVAFGTSEDRPPLSAAELGRMALAGRAYAVALAAVRRAERLAHRHELAIAALDLCSTPVVLVSGSAVPELNRATREVLDRTVEGRDLVFDLIARPAAHASAFTKAVEVRWVGGGRGVVRAHARQCDADPDALIVVLEYDDDAGEALTGPRWVSLTARERDVARLVARGLGDREIAERLVLSPYTVKQHVRSIYRKSGVRSRIELVRRALSDGPGRIRA